MMNITECREIYRNVFRDEDTAFEDLLFKNCSQYLKVLCDGEDTASMLFLMPVSLDSQKNIKGAYLYAAATKPEYRKRGYMSALINSILNEYDFILLRPATASLIDYYSKLGFKTIEVRKTAYAEIKPLDGYEKLVQECSISDNGEQYTAMYYSNIPLKLKEIQFNYSMN